MNITSRKRKTKHPCRNVLRTKLVQNKDTSSRSMPAMPNKLRCFANFLPKAKHSKASQPLSLYQPATEGTTNSHKRFFESQPETLSLSLAGGAKIGIDTVRGMNSEIQETTQKSKQNLPKAIEFHKKLPQNFEQNLK